MRNPDSDPRRPEKPPAGEMMRRLEVVTGPIDPAYDPAQSRGHRAIQQAFGPGGVVLGPALRRCGRFSDRGTQVSYK